MNEKKCSKVKKRKKLVLHHLSCFLYYIIHRLREGYNLPIARGLGAKSRTGEKLRIDTSTLDS